MTRLPSRGQRVRHFDENLPDDIEEVLDVAASLEIREFDVFFFAYKWWNGNPPNEKLLENIYANYMFHDIVPHWVRQFTRMALNLKSDNKLTREALGIDRIPDTTPALFNRGVRYSIIVVLFIALLILAAEFAETLSANRCMFPPCY